MPESIREKAAVCKTVTRFEIKGAFYRPARRAHHWLGENAEQIEGAGRVGCAWSAWTLRCQDSRTRGDERQVSAAHHFRACRHIGSLSVDHGKGVTLLVQGIEDGDKLGRPRPVKAKGWKLPTSILPTANFSAMAAAASGKVLHEPAGDRSAVRPLTPGN